jgi:hypothetical protein
MTVREKIQGWLDETHGLMVQKYDELGFRASGEWEQDLSNSIDETGGKYIAKIEGANYTYWMEHGRKAGKFPPIAKIRKWIDDKGIQTDLNKNSLAFLIARKISREGTRHRPGIVSDVLTQNHIQKLYDVVGGSLIESMKSDVIKTFK